MKTRLWVSFAFSTMFVLAPAVALAQPGSGQEETPTLTRVRAPAKPLSKEEVAAKAKELRAKYPFESVAKRLGYEDIFAAASKDAPAPTLNEEANKHLEALEVSGTGSPFSGFGLRTRGLQMLHSEQVERFISSEGFGISRLPQPTPEHLELVHTDAVHYPRYLLDSTELQGPDFRELKGEVLPWQLPGREVLLHYHLQGQLNFAGPNTLGLVRDRDHVSGFKSHQFQSVPKLITKWDRDVSKPLPEGSKLPPIPQVAEEWVLRKLELVSLLKQKKPAVYVSATLPKMDELDDAETRELSTFEADSLKTLRSGESLVARAKPNHLEMFGALRAGKQCQQCHQVQRGELLGAFSYELHRSPALKPAKGEAASGG